MGQYSFKTTLKKAATELALVAAAAVAVAVGEVLINPGSVGLDLPTGEVGLMAMAVLAAIGRGLINAAKNMGKRPLE